MYVFFFGWDKILIFARAKYKRIYGQTRLTLGLDSPQTRIFLQKYLSWARNEWTDKLKLHGTTSLLPEANRSRAFLSESQ